MNGFVASYQVKQSFSLKRKTMVTQKALYSICVADPHGTELCLTRFLCMSLK